MPERPASTRPPWQPRFTIAGMMLTTLVCAVAAAGVSYLVRFGGESRAGILIFLLITLAGPLVLLVTVSIVHAISTHVSRPRKRRRP